MGISHAALHMDYLKFVIYEIKIMSISSQQWMVHEWPGHICHEYIAILIKCDMYCFIIASIYTSSGI